ncbi:DNA-binding protein [Reticulomyxa filosa]|uniref:DNA-binding protein n=1 Tax=Reticulomyxa filosa TaxID=46433 RepID=X6M5C6_RETFI|nr:DNA-binding protein [Reticulomyxa filosa]|eukprot:ETO08235.1 DNA-binding protein [Reticulomyxa filosa]
MATDDRKTSQETSKPQLNKPKCIILNIVHNLEISSKKKCVFWLIVGKIKDLSPNSRGGHNLVVKVIENPKLEINRLYLDGTELRVASALVGDDTGCVSLHLKDDQIDMVEKDDTLILRNAQLQMSKFRIYLKVDQWGMIEKCAPEQYGEKINTQNNEFFSSHFLAKERDWLFCFILLSRTFFIEERKNERQKKSILNYNDNFCITNLMCPDFFIQKYLNIFHFEIFK